MHKATTDENTEYNLESRTTELFGQLIRRTSDPKGQLNRGQLARRTTEPERSGQLARRTTEPPKILMLCISFYLCSRL